MKNTSKTFLVYAPSTTKLAVLVTLFIFLVIYMRDVCCVPVENKNLTTDALKTILALKSSHDTRTSTSVDANIFKPDLGMSTMEKTPAQFNGITLKTKQKRHTDYQTFKVFGGKQVIPNEFPFQVVFLTPEISCGGTILTENFILTAAHCLIGPNAENYRNWKIVAGEHNLQVNEGKEQIRRIADVHIHRNYNPDSKVNDVAIVKLDLPLQLSKEVHPILLPNADYEASGIAVVTGWGIIRLGGSSPNVLRKVLVPIVSHADCVKLFEKDQVFVSNKMLCAGDVVKGGVDACQGDSGGPLSVKLSNGSFLLVGVVSSGIKCGLAEYPGIYMQVSKYFHWIHETLIHFVSTITESSSMNIKINALTTSEKRGTESQASTVINRSNAQPHEFPFQVIFLDSTRLHCAGTILDENFILTSAQCLYNDDGYEYNAEEYRSWRIVAGDHNVRIDEGKEQIRHIQYVYIHENFKLYSRVNDLAILKLDSPLQFGKEVKPVLLPSANYEANGEAVLTGWGTFRHGQSNPPELQTVKVRIVDRAECVKAYEEKQVFVSIYMMCTGNDSLVDDSASADACAADPGGPLSVKLTNGSWMLIGVVSSGSGCARAEYPGIYMQVSKYIDWIQDTLPKFNNCLLYKICQNGGICNTDGTNDFSCKCQRGYYGKDCSLVDHCADLTCSEGSVCRNNIPGRGSASCECHDGLYYKCPRTCIILPTRRRNNRRRRGIGRYSGSCSPQRTNAFWFGDQYTIGKK